MPYYLRSQFGCHRLTAPRFNFSPVAGMFKGDASFPSAEGDDSRLLHALELGEKKKKKIKRLEISNKVNSSD